MKPRLTLTRIGGGEPIIVGPDKPWTDLYYYLITARWPFLLGIIAGLFFILNLIFALGYYCDSGIERARGLYESAWPLIPLLPPPGRAVFMVLARTYQALLDVMEQQNYDVFTKRIRLSAWRKLGFALSALPVRWGWA